MEVEAFPAYTDLEVLGDCQQALAAWYLEKYSVVSK